MFSNFGTSKMDMNYHVMSLPRREFWADSTVMSIFLGIHRNSSSAFSTYIHSEQIIQYNTQLARPLPISDTISQRPFNLYWSTQLLLYKQHLMQILYCILSQLSNSILLFLSVVPFRACHISSVSYSLMLTSCPLSVHKISSMLFL